MEKVQTLVKALSDKEEIVRKNAIEGLKVLSNSNDFGYNSKLEADKQKDALTKWQNWSDAEKQRLERLELLKNSSAYLKSKPKINTAKDVEKVNILVQSLKSDDQYQRQLAFDGLFAYTSKKFDYDLKADKAKQLEAQKKWQDWFEKEMKPITVKEEKRFEKVNTIAKDLNTKDLSSKDKMQAFNGLIESLDDVALRVRDKAYTTLIKVADKKVAGYDPKTPDKKGY